MRSTYAPPFLSSTESRSQESATPEALPPALPVPDGKESIEANDWFFSLIFASGGPSMPRSLPLSARVARIDYLKHWDAFFVSHRLETRWRAVRSKQSYFHEFMVLMLQVVKDSGSVATALGLQEEAPFMRRRYLAWCGLANLAPLYHLLHGGQTLKPTEVLGTLLHHSDIGLGLPASLFHLPTPHIYLPLKSSPVEPGPFEGVYCFDGKNPDGLRFITLVFMGKEWSQSQGRNGLVLQIVILDEQAPLETFIEQGVAMIEVEEDLKDIKVSYVAVAKAHTNYLVKLFLYMSLPEARKVTHRNWSEHEAKLARLGPKKAAKLNRKATDDLFDYLEVGPEIWPQRSPTDGDGHEVSPHWRRGHFRHQPCGPRNQERKLIFVAPVMVRVDRFHEGSPSAMR